MVVVVCGQQGASELTPVALGFLETLRPFSGFTGRHSSSSSSSFSFSSSLGDISSSMLMVAFCGALAVVKRLTLGFRDARQSVNNWPFSTHIKSLKGATSVTDAEELGICHKKIKK